MALTVSDVDRSAAFYADHFDFARRLHQGPTFVLLAHADGSMLALTPGSPPAAPRDVFHFGFQVDTAEEVRRARQRLGDAGVVESEWEVEDGGYLRLQVLDPDGYAVEIFNA